jgi:autotransporter-associated beta strand protein
VSGKFKLRTCAAATVILLALIAAAAFGADQTWLIPGSDANWNDGGAWTGGGYPGVAGDIARLTANIPAGVRTVSLNGLTISLGGMYLGDTNGDGNYLVVAGAGGRLVFDSGAAGAQSLLWQGQGAASDRIWAPVTLNSTLRVDLADGNLYLSGPVVGAGGIVAAGQAGSGALWLMGGGTYSGGTQIVGGWVYAGASGTLGTGLVGLSGGGLGLYGAGSVATAISNDVSVSGDSAIRSTSAGAALQQRLDGNVSLHSGRLVVSSDNACSLAITGTTTLDAAVILQSQASAAANLLTISGRITGAGALQKTGPGSLTLSGAGNDFTGGFTAIDGSTYVRSAGALGTGSAVIGGAAYLEANAASALAGPSSMTVRYATVDGSQKVDLATFDANVLNGANVTLAGGYATFSATQDMHLGGNITLAAPAGVGLLSRIGVLGTGAAAGNKITVDSLTLAPGSAVTLCGDAHGMDLSVAGTTTLQGGQAVLNVLNSSAGNFSDLILAGRVTGGGQLVKNGTGSADPLYRDMVVLQNPANDFTGGIQINAGSVRGTAAGVFGSGAIVLNGSLQTDASRSQLELIDDVGTNFASNVVMAGDGWIWVDGATGITTGGVHTLGNLTHTQGATLYVDGENNFGLTFNGTATLGGTANFYVNLTGSSLTLAGPLVGAGSTLVKEGPGLMFLTSGADANFTGGVAVRSDVLELDGPAALTGASSVEVFAGGSLILGNSVTNLGNRLSDSGQLTMRGGTFELVGTPLALTTESAGVLKLASGDSWIVNFPDPNAGSTRLSFSNFSRDAGATANFSTLNGPLGTVANQIRLKTDGNQVTLTNGILGGWATVDSDWATYDANLGVLALNSSRYLGDAVDGNWTPTVNARPGGAVTLTNNRTINSLNLVAGNTIDANVFTLNIGTGGLIASGGNRKITGGKLTAGGTAGGELFATVGLGAPPLVSWALTVYSAIVDANGGSGPVTLVMSGGGTLVLCNTNTYSGGTFIGEGTVEANAVGRLGSGNVTLSGGTLSLVNDASTNFAKNIILKDNDSTISVGSYGGAAGLAFTLGSLTLGPAALTVDSPNGVSTIFSGTTTLSGAAQIVLDTAGSDLRLAGKLTGAGSLAKSGDGVLYLTGTGSDFSGGWRLESGAMDANQAGALGTGAGLVRGGTLYARAASVLDANALVTVNAGGAVNLYAAQNQSAGAVVLAGGTLTLLRDSNTAFGVNVAINPNTLDASAASVIQVDRATSGGATDQLHSIKGLAINNAALAVTSSSGVGDDLQVIGVTTLTGSGVIYLNSTGGPGVKNLTLAGQVTGSGTLTRAGIAGQLVLAAANNNYTGGTVVLGGRLVGESFGSGAITLNGGAGCELDLRADAGGTKTYGNDVIVAGNAIISMNSWSAPNPNVTHRLGGLTIGGGAALQVGVSGDSALGDDLEFTGTTTLTGAAELAIGTANCDLILSGAVTGGGALIKSGGGDLYLKATNNFTGDLIVSGGRVRAQAPGALGLGVLQLGGGQVDALVAGVWAPGANVTVNSGAPYTFGSSAGASYPSTGGVHLYASQPGVTFNLDGGLLAFHDPYGPGAAKGDFGVNLLVSGGGGTIVNKATILQPGSPDANLSRSLLNSGILTVNNSTVVLRSDTDAAWSAQVVTTGNSLIRLGQVDSNLAAGALHSVGDLVNSGSLDISSDTGLGDALKIGTLSGGGTTTVDPNTLVFISQFDDGSLVIGPGSIVVLGGNFSSYSDWSWLTGMAASSGAPDVGSDSVPDSAAYAAPGAVPEPGAVSVVVLGMAALLRRRARRR